MKDMIQNLASEKWKNWEYLDPIFPLEGTWYFGFIKGANRVPLVEQLAEVKAECVFCYNLE